MYLIVYFVILILILTGSTFFLRYIVESVFHKTITFSNRTIVWQRVILQIIDRPIFGSGYINYQVARDLLGSLTYNHAHNQWLQILWNGGLCLLLIFLIFIYEIAHKINSIHNKRKCLGVSLIFLAVLINMIFEVHFGLLPIWVLLYIIANFYRFDIKNEL